MGDQIRFHESWFRFVPILKGADRDLLFEQGSRTGRGNALSLLLAVRLQKPISRRPAHGEELAPALFIQGEVSMSLQRLHQSR